MGKYDETLYQYLEDNERFADLFNGLCFNGEKVVRPEELTELSERESGNGSSKYRDLKKLWNQGGCLRILASEHQAEVDYTMPWRIMNADCLTYHKQIRRIRRKNDREQTYATPAEKLCGFKKTDKLNPVYTLCLYHGEEKWNGPFSLKDMMKQGSVSSLFQNYGMNLFHVNEVTDPDRFQTSLRELFKILKLRGKHEEMKQLLRTDSRYGELDRETMETIGIMIHQKSILKNMEKYRVKEETYSMCLAFQEEREEGRREGEASGILIGEKRIKHIIFNMIKAEKYSIEEIAELTGYTAEEIRQMEDKKEEF